MGGKQGIDHDFVKVGSPRPLEPKQNSETVSYENHSLSDSTATRWRSTKGEVIFGYYNYIG